jgi:hypothetical protein
MATVRITDKNNVTKQEIKKLHKNGEEGYRISNVTQRTW